MDHPVIAQDDKPIVIAHRGASGYRPEHTMMGYRMALAQGADYIEPDLVMSKDGHLLIRHDIYLSSSTDVAAHPEFADRKRVIEGHEDWFVFDFTLAELKTLRARQPRPERGTMFDGVETIPTFDEAIAWILAEKANGATAGLYIEMKRPAMFIEAGLDPTAKLLAGFKKLTDAGIPVYFQCFEGDYLVKFRGKTKAQLIWLIEGREDATTGHATLDVPLGLYGDKIDGVGLYKALLFDERGNPNDVVEQAHDLGLKVHLWTLRNDQVPKMFGSVEEELKTLFGLGIDGVFADFPDTAVQSRNSVQLLGAGPQSD